MTTPKEKPILFSDAMVRALLNGTKTQTRRVIKPQPHADTQALRDIPGTPHWYAAYAEPNDFGVSYRPLGSDKQHPWKSRINVGDTLWVREAFHAYHEDGAKYVYRATPHRVFKRFESYDVGKWTSPIHMPRWAARIFLRVTEVRAERLQDISESDAVAEGCRSRSYRDGRGEESAVFVYRELWNKINGKSHPWESNPWVWVYMFERINQ